MTRKTYTYEATLSWGGDEPTGEMEVVATYTVCWGRPETPPAFDHGGLPADPTLIEDVEIVSLDGHTSGFDFYKTDAEIIEDCLFKLEDHYDRMLDHAEAEEAC